MEIVDLGIGPEEGNGAQFIGEGGFRKQGVELALTDAAKDGRGAQSSTLGPRYEMMDRVAVHLPLPKLALDSIDSAESGSGLLKGPSSQSAVTSLLVGATCIAVRRSRRGSNGTSYADSFAFFT